MFVLKYYVNSENLPEEEYRKLVRDDQYQCWVDHYNDNGKTFMTREEYEVLSEKLTHIKYQGFNE